MRKIAATVIGAALLLGMGATPADAAPRYRNLTVSKVCDYEDGSGPRDTSATTGCAFYSDTAVYVNYDGGTRWFYVPATKKGVMPEVTPGKPLRVTIDAKHRKVISVRHGKTRWGASKIHG